MSTLPHTSPGNFRVSDEDSDSSASPLVLPREKDWRKKELEDLDTLNGMRAVVEKYVRTFVFKDVKFQPSNHTTEQIVKYATKQWNESHGTKRPKELNDTVMTNINCGRRNIQSLARKNFLSK